MLFRSNMDFATREQVEVKRDLYVPVSALSQFFGAEVELIKDGKGAVIRTKEEEFEVVSESVACLHGGFLEAMFMPARIRDGVLFVPLRWFAEVIFRRFVTECDGALYFSGHYGEMSKDMAYLIKEILA